MTWQDEFRRLDEELAAGRLSADDYRQRRDQLLAATNSAANNPATGAQPAQSSDAQGQQPGTGGAATQQPGTGGQPVQQQPDASGQAPAQKPAAGGQTAQQSDSGGATTQHPGAEATQQPAAPAAASGQPAQQPPNTGGQPVQNPASAAQPGPGASEGQTTAQPASGEQPVQSPASGPQQAQNPPSGDQATQYVNPAAQATQYVYPAAQFPGAQYPAAPNQGQPGSQQAPGAQQTQYLSPQAGQQSFPNPATGGHPVQNPGTGGHPVQNPPSGGQQAQQPSSPFPPPFRWDSTPAGQPSAPSGSEGTQVVNPVAGPGAADPEATQRVSPRQFPQGNEPTQQVSGFTPQGGPSDATQIVRPQSGGFPQGWATQGGAQGWPQQGAPFGAQSQTGAQNQPNQFTGGEQQSNEPSWMRQGPEVFDDGEGSNTGKIIGIIVGVVVVIALVVGAIFLWPKGNSTQANKAPATSAAPAAPKGPLAAGIPGKTEEPISSSVKSFTDIASMRTPLLSKDEQSIYQTANAGNAALLYNNDNGNGILLLAVAADNAESAKQAASELSAQQLRYGLKNDPSTMPGVTVTGIDNAPDTPSAPVLRRVHYVSGKEIVRIEIRGKDLATVQSLLTDVLKKETAALPPDAA